MRLYLDENILDPRLRALLRKQGHHTVTPAEAGKARARDPIHLLYALQQRLVVLTRNHLDFRPLHELVIGSGGSHSGILLIYEENDPTRDMKVPHVITAIGKLEASGVPLANELHVLNHWR
jgi:predicted nuclease of predicted toxin-antitoxin system